MRRTFITKKTHYTGSFRICAALWGTFIIFFISKSFLSSRLCGKWVTFISLQIQIVQPRATVLSSECLELFYSRGQSSDSLSEDYLEAFALFSSVGKNTLWNLLMQIQEDHVWAAAQHWELLMSQSCNNLAQSLQSKHPGIFMIPAFCCMNGAFSWLLKKIFCILLLCKNWILVSSVTAGEMQ